MSRKRPMWWRLTRVVGAPGDVAVTVHGRNAEDRPLVLALTDAEARRLSSALYDAAEAALGGERQTFDMERAR